MERPFTTLSTSSNPKQADAADKIELTDVEEGLRRLLLDVAQYIEHSSPHGDGESPKPLPEELAAAKLELRFTGGWVRDKLLGIDSHDIDVGINKMTGFQFGLRMKEYLESSGNAEKYGIGKEGALGGLHKIEANPEKSKHLETVTTKVFGLDIDLVNLRKETYSENSRNPQMEFGTPEEDALRRDATVNALFYNLTTNSIEDFTGRGFEDMRRKIIRTPLKPYQTFKDDPLRVLRLIRFASRLGYTIDPDTKAAMSNEDIKEALKLKISRERVGVELEKMLKGPEPLKALQLIDETGLYATIFTDPTRTNKYQPQTEHWLSPCFVLDQAFRSQEETFSTLARSSGDQYIMWVLAAVTPWADAPQPERPRREAKLPLPVATDVVRESIKATNKICEIVTLSVQNAGEITRLKDRIVARKRHPQRPIEGDDPCGRDTIGMSIRRWGATWRFHVAFALLLESKASPESEEGILRDYTTFVTTIRDLDLLEACNLKPIVDGKQLAKALSIRPGPWMKDALDVVMAWQLRNPGITDPSAAIEEVAATREAQQDSKGELAASLIDHFLRLTIRPLFAKAQTPMVTAQGRKVTREILPKSYSNLDFDEEISKPWKKDPYVLELLRWSLGALDDATVEQSWPLLIPPILTIVDDRDPTFKALGCELLTLLLHATPPPLLVRTGLGEVMEEAVMPCTAYLPTLTPEEQSYALLGAAYTALFALGDVRYPSQRQEQSTSTPADSQKVTYLNRILHNAFLPSLSHLSPPSRYPRLVTLLLTQFPPLLSRLAVHTTPHLRALLPLFSSTLRDIWSGAGIDVNVRDAVDVSLAGTAALSACVRCAWPRIWAWRAEVLAGMVACWIGLYEARLDASASGSEAEPRRRVGEMGAARSPTMGRIVEVDDEDETTEPEGSGSVQTEGLEHDVARLRAELKAGTKMLAAATRAGDLEGSVDFDGEIKRIVQADERLAGLFDR